MYAIKWQLEGKKATHTRKDAPGFTYIHTYLHTYIHTHIHTYIHIHVLECNDTFYVCTVCTPCLSVKPHIHMYIYRTEPTDAWEDKRLNSLSNGQNLLMSMGPCLCFNLLPLATTTPCDGGQAGALSGWPTQRQRLLHGICAHEL